MGQAIHQSEIPSRLGVTAPAAPFGIRPLFSYAGSPKAHEIQRYLDQFAEPSPIELAASKSIDASQGSKSAARSPVPGQKNAESSAPFAQSRKPARRCLCGSCKTCQDAARWERVFHEKFADPDYYSRCVARNGSSLSWLS